VEQESLYSRFLETGADDDWNRVVASLVPVFARVVYRVSRQYSMSDAGVVEDALQEALLKLHAQRDRLRQRLAEIEIASVEPYLKVLAANAARDFLRSQGGGQRAEPAADDITFEGFLANLGVSSKPEAEESLLYSEIDRALGEDDRDRTAFWLYYRWGFKAREIASIPALSLSVKGVESLLPRTAERVRRSLHAEHKVPVSRRPDHV
jgi:RNA polymerase sigma-70 factor, ECF subfamily